MTLNEDTSEFTARTTFDHPYPTTKIMWIPDSRSVLPDLLATSGDYLRIWRVADNGATMESLLNNVSLYFSILNLTKITTFLYRTKTATFVLP